MMANPFPAGVTGYGFKPAYIFFYQVPVMNIKRYAMIAVAIVLLVFILQNVTVVEIRFLFWQLSVSRAIMFFILLAVGMIIGWLLHGYYRLRKNSRLDN